MFTNSRPPLFGSIVLPRVLQPPEHGTSGMQVCSVHLIVAHYCTLSTGDYGLLNKMVWELVNSNS